VTHAVRTRLALGSVVATALLPALGVIVTTATNPGVLRRRDDPISAFERRVAPLRATLQGEREVGYLPPAHVDREAHLYTMRYALAPVQVVEDASLALVVADAADAGALPAHLRVRRDFGQGLLLLERVP
jgi:hypothetical protein